MSDFQLSSNLSILRRSAAELLAVTILDLFPTALLLGGGENSFGFFYEVIFQQPLHEQTLELIEARMKEFIREQAFEMRSVEMMRENAQTFFEHHQQPLLAEKAGQQKSNIVPLLQIGSFYGLCEAPHVADLEELRSFKLLGYEEIEREILSESYLVTRLYGAVFPDLGSLKTFSKAYQNLKKRDHRLLGQELQLVYLDSLLGSLEPIWTPKGEFLKNILFHLGRPTHFNLQEVQTPAFIPSSTQNSREYPFLTVGDQIYSSAPSCLRQHVELLSKLRKTDENPIRIVEKRKIFQKQSDSQLWGLFQNYSYLMDCVTVSCPDNRLLEELISSLQFIEEMVRIFSFEYRWYLVAFQSSKSSVPKETERVQKLKQAAEQSQVSYQIDWQRKEKFFPPRLEVRVVDSLGREWPTGFITLEGEMSKLVEASSSQQDLRSMVMSGSFLGPIDRLVGLLIEQEAGYLPFWLAPEQVRVVTVGEHQQAYADWVCKSLKEQGIRVALDQNKDKLSAKIHAAEKEKIPYLLIIGDKEANKKWVTVRTIYQKGDKHETLSLEALIERLNQSNERRPQRCKC